MKYRKLRIAWSVWWGVVAVLLCALWCRTYSWIDRFSRQTGTQTWTVRSIYGRASLRVESERFTAMAGEWRHHVAPIDAVTRRKQGVLFPVGGKLGFYHDHGSTVHTWAAPYWAPFSLSAVLAVLPWLRHFRYGFSLRTLLIATTVSSAALGACVYLNRLLEPQAVPVAPDQTPPALWPTYTRSNPGEFKNSTEVLLPYDTEPIRIYRPPEDSLFK